jgi:hypothetical protein
MLGQSQGETKEPEVVGSSGFYSSSRGPTSTSTSFGVRVPLVPSSDPSAASSSNKAVRSSCKRLVLVIDRSFSMRGSLPYLTTRLKDILQNTPKSIKEFVVLSFNHGVTVHTFENKSGITGSLDGLLKAGGKTDLNKAFKKLQKHLAGLGNEAKNDTKIIGFTDGAHDPGDPKRDNTTFHHEQVKLWVEQGGWDISLCGLTRNSDPKFAQITPNYCYTTDPRTYAKFIQTELTMRTKVKRLDMKWIFKDEKGVEIQALKGKVDVLKTRPSIQLYQRINHSLVTPSAHSYTVEIAGYKRVKGVFTEPNEEDLLFLRFQELMAVHNKIQEYNDPMDQFEYVWTHEGDFLSNCRKLATDCITLGRDCPTLPDATSLLGYAESIVGCDSDPRLTMSSSHALRTNPLMTGGGTRIVDAQLVSDSMYLDLPVASQVTSARDRDTAMAFAKKDHASNLCGGCNPF